jgi:hypothetical protein
LAGIRLRRRSQAYMTGGFPITNGKQKGFLVLCRNPFFFALPD